LVIVGEPTELALCGAHPGVVDVDSLFHGVPGHGADTRSCASAIAAASAFVTALSSAESDRWSFNAGVIRGGSARNVIAGECAVSWELRFQKDIDLDDVLADAVPPPRVIREDRVLSILPPFNASAEARGVAATLAGVDESDVIRLPFVTEAGVYAQSGLPAIVCGPGGWMRAHQANEFVLGAELSNYIDLIAKILRQG